MKTIHILVAAFVTVIGLLISFEYLGMANFQGLANIPYAVMLFPLSFVLGEATYHALKSFRFCANYKDVLKKGSRFYAFWGSLCLFGRPIGFFIEEKVLPKSNSPIFIWFLCLMLAITVIPFIIFTMLHHLSRIGKQSDP